MPNISIRDVDQNTLEEVKRIAAANGRSMQAELRLLLKRFAELPWETQLGTYPVAMLPLPRWYTDLWSVRADFIRLSADHLPPRRSSFRALTLPLQQRGQQWADSSEGAAA